ncbi:hypothetical protein [Planctomicrobium sp. SH527]|uniref:hypothetical protein n=1 Tax=Planctomicrobium sp. SH527 TaxID=3448123 RepID=UPI003F5B4241
MTRVALKYGITFILLFGVSDLLRAQPEDFEGVIAKPKVEVIYSPIRLKAAQGTFPKSLRVKELHNLEFTGPKPSHPFVLGNFSSDARWAVVNGYLQSVSGNDGAIQLAWANEFQLDGVIEQAGVGGWFMLVGWDEGRGFAIHNVTMKESGSPWFITEFRGGKAIEGRFQEFPKFEWKGEQPFQLQIVDEKLTLTIGRHRLFEEQVLPGYTEGQIILGIHDTRYGPRPLRIKSLKIQSKSAE